MYGLHGENLMTEIKILFEEKLALIPGTKLVIGNIQLSIANVWADAIAPETLEVYFSRETALATMLELLNKRWQTLDLISVMQEVKRTLASSHAHSRYLSSDDVLVNENLSCVPRLQKVVDKSLGQVDSKQE